MRDNKPGEFMAEQYISSELLKYDIKTSKPYFDENGTDLLIIDQVNRSETAILRVQSKGRRYAKSKSSNVTIPQNYVSTNFLLGLYVVDEHYQSDLYIFFEEDLKNLEHQSERRILHDDIGRKPGQFSNQPDVTSRRRKDSATTQAGEDQKIHHVIDRRYFPAKSDSNHPPHL